jgi:hypothetical protein
VRKALGRSPEKASPKLFYRQEPDERVEDEPNTMASEARVIAFAVSADVFSGRYFQEWSTPLLRYLVCSGLTVDESRAEGIRTTETSAAGEREIQIVNEVWTQDLKAVVLSKGSDPRTGEMTYRLVNIQRSEPDSSLFAVPPDYSIVDAPEKGMMIFRPKD